MNPSSATTTGKWANLEYFSFQFDYSQSIANFRTRVNWFIARGHVAVAPSLINHGEIFIFQEGLREFFFQFSIFCTLDRLLSTSTDISRKLKVVIIYYIFFTVHSEVEIALCESENRIETHFRFLLAKRDTPEEGKVWKINHRKYRDDTEIFFNLKTFVHTRESIRNGRLSFVVY